MSWRWSSTRRSRSAVPSAASSCWSAMTAGWSSSWAARGTVSPCRVPASRPAARFRRRCSGPGGRASRRTCSRATSPPSTRARWRSASAMCCVCRCGWCATSSRPTAPPRTGGSASSTSTAERRACCCRVGPARRWRRWPPKRRLPSTTPSCTGPPSRRRGSTRRWPRRPRSSRRCCRHATGRARSSRRRPRCWRAGQSAATSSNTSTCLTEGSVSRSATSLARDRRRRYSAPYCRGIWRPRRPSPPVRPTR